MTIDEQVKYWEFHLKEAEERLHGLSEATRQGAYWKDIAPYKLLLRSTRDKAGIPICWGAIDCLDHPTAKCQNGHETCKAHNSSCWRCTIETTK